MLGVCEIMAFVPTAHPDHALTFYRDTLGLELREDSPFALVFQAGRTMLRVQKVAKFTPLQSTLLGWRVPDIRAAIEALSGRSVSFERYDGMNQDALGIWRAPSGAKVAWFKDPDGNTLSLTEFPAD